MTKQDLVSHLGSSLKKLALVIVVVVQVFLLVISVAAFHKIEALVVMLKITHAALPPVTLLIISSLAPLMIAVLLVMMIKVSKTRARFIHVLAGAVTLYYAASALFLCYRAETGFAFDWLIVRYHFTDAIETAAVLSSQYRMLFGISALALVLYYWGLVVLLRRAGARVSMAAANLPNKLHSPAVIGGMLILVGTHVYAENNLFNLIQESRETKSAAKTLYARYYEDSISRVKGSETFKPDRAMNENLFLFHLESVNADLVQESITPRFLQIAKQRGVFFPRIQAPSIFTILSQESILCSVLPALERNLAESEHLRDGLVCLPRILKNFGFKTLYFHSLPNIHFANTDTFMKAIGFDEWHASDIMKPGDRKSSWGYVEDIFYQRVFEQLSRFRGQKIFAYIQVNTTNHYPFYNDEKKAAFPQFDQKLPFKKPETQRERMGDSMYIQDYYFGQMYDELFRKDYAQNSHVIVFGDHSFPIGKHEGNLFNINGAFQENFVTSLAVLPAENSWLGNRLVKGKEVHRLYSYVDILPTVLEMYGIRDARYYGSSFFPELVTRTKDKRGKECIVSVQPYSGGYISIINYPEKRLFDLKKGMVTVYDLVADPNEMKPLQEGEIQQEHLNLLERCLRSLKEKSVNANSPADFPAR